MTRSSGAKCGEEYHDMRGDGPSVLREQAGAYLRLMMARKQLQSKRFLCYAGMETGSSSDEQTNRRADGQTNGLAY